MDGSTGYDLAAGIHLFCFKQLRTHVVAIPPCSQPIMTHTHVQLQVYGTLLSIAASASVGIDLVTYFDEMHESVFRAVTALPFAVRKRYL